MTPLRYTLIKTQTQYRHYCTLLEKLVDQKSRSKAHRDEIELLTHLIETWDRAHATRVNRDPIQLLKSLMNDHGLLARDLVVLLNVSKGYVSDVLNYKKGLSKEVIRKLAVRFSMAQEAFNRPYPLVGDLPSKRVRKSKRVFVR